MAKKKKKTDDGFNDNGTVKMPERPVRTKSDAPKKNAIDELVYENSRVINVLEIRISLLNQRIDRIVEAHEKCKSLKGL